jgi:serine protease Do
MKKNLFIGKILLAVLIFCSQSKLAASDDASSVMLRIKDKFGSSVFTVHAYQKLLPSKTGEKRIKKRRNVGTAFPFDNAGHLLTLSSVVRDAEKIVITGNGNKQLNAAPLGNDENGRITVLKTEKQAPFSLPPTRSMNSLKPGSRLFFLGAPRGKSLSAMMGVVESVQESDCIIVVTLSSGPGTSGTPVFDENGQIVGLLAYHIGETGNHEGGNQSLKDSYVVYPMDYISMMAQSIIHNSTDRGGWLGVSVEIAGGSIRNVIRDSPADKGGIKPGDNIVEINGSPISSSGDLVKIMSATSPGETLLLKILRGGESVPLTIKLTAHPHVK